MNIELTPTEVALVAAAVADKIAALDAGTARFEAEADRLGVSLDAEAATVVGLIRAAYDRIARRCAQQLDVPFVDQDEAVRMLFAEGTVVIGIRV